MSSPSPIAKTGYELIRSSLLNKGTAFTPQERTEFGLHGLLPNQHNTIAQQGRRVYEQISALDKPLDKYVSLSALQDRNETLFYAVLNTHLSDLMPIVYTPTVGLATQHFSHVFQRGRGLWITPDFQGHMVDVLRKVANEHTVRLIVATDSESILGIGDQGAGGMAISIGKLALYVVGAGIFPGQTVPICLDVGTNNKALLEDELYLGWPHERLRGEAYDMFIEEFVTAVKTVFPEALLQWEDFRKDNALRLLNKHRNRIVSFNDDIQGTGAIALAGILSALRVTGQKLTDQRIVVYGAGAAGLGIARQIKAALRDAGLTSVQISACIAVLDSRGLLVDDREFSDTYKEELAWPVALAKQFNLETQRALEAVIEHYQPTVLIGASGQGGAFTQAIVERMALHVERPIILPFSNPTAISEATPYNILHWTQGRALVAAGSPFEPVTVADKTYQIGQGNNVFIFPGLGLGALVSRSSEITDTMVSAAAQALANATSDAEIESGLLFPAVERLREVSQEVAASVARCALSEGVAGASWQTAQEDIYQNRWFPEYVPYRKALED